jgi:hypothetical protein
MILPDTLPGPARRYLGHLETAARSLEQAEQLAPLTGPDRQKELTCLVADFIEELVRNVEMYHRPVVEPVRQITEIFEPDPEEDDDPPEEDRTPLVIETGDPVGLNP